MTLQKSYDFCYVRLALFCSSEILNGVALTGKRDAYPTFFPNEWTTLCLDRLTHRKLCPIRVPNWPKAGTACISTTAWIKPR